jgi:hypothetical protein
LLESGHCFERSVAQTRDIIADAVHKLVAWTFATFLEVLPISTAAGKEPDLFQGLAVHPARESIEKLRTLATDGKLHLYRT